MPARVLQTSCLALSLICCLTGQAVVAQASTVVAHGEEASKEEVYGAVFLLGSLPMDRNLNVGGEELGSTTVKNGAGGGFKIGVFPAFTKHILGIQGELFGLGNKVSAPSSSGSVGTQSGRGTILAWNTLVSLVMRYPGERFQPYVGVGAGWSTSLLVDADLVRGSSTQSGIARDTSFAYQYLGGLRANLTQRLFVFGEYKYFASRYSWSGNLRPSLDYRTHIVALGIGLSF
ncbi:MAG TPA: outer membrane beta-barrel protein [Nitrospira sp.]